MDINICRTPRQNSEGRALKIGKSPELRIVPLEALRAELSAQEKDDWLQQTILEKVGDKAIRFHAEPTFFLDE